MINMNISVIIVTTYYYIIDIVFICEPVKLSKRHNYMLLLQIYLLNEVTILPVKSIFK